MMMMMVIFGLGVKYGDSNDDVYHRAYIYVGVGMPLPDGQIITRQ